MLAFALTREPIARDRTPEVAAAIHEATTQLDRAIGVAQARVSAQAGKLASQQVVRGVIVTDEASALDALGTVDLGLQPGELLQVGQVAGPTVTPLFTHPRSANATVPAIRDGRPGMHADLIDDRLWLSQIVKVTPHKMKAADGTLTDYRTDDGELVLGYLMLSHAVDLAPTREVFAKYPGRFEVADKALTFGAVPARSQVIARALNGMPDARVVVAVPAPLRIGGRPSGLLASGGAVGVLGLAVVMLGLILPRPRKAAAEPPRRPARTPEPRPLPWLSSRPRQMTDPPADLFELDRTAVDTEPPGPSRSPGPTPSSGRFTGPVGTPFQPTSPHAESSGSFQPGIIRAGTVIGRWEVIRQLGGGGMADVYLAQARGEGGFEKHVAIKVMHPHLARDERTIAHFLDERGSLPASRTRTSSRSRPRQDRHDYFIVMEYIDGLDLERVLAASRAGGRAVPVHIGLGILRRICDGLTAAHQATSPDGKPLGIIHRDVKSANVLISRQGAVKVVDFGIAKATAQLHHTLAGETKGTPAVMAPEQRVGDVVDVRADVYSVGAVAYELLTGQSVNVDFAALAHLGIDNWPHLARPSAVRTALPAEVDKLVFGAMAYDRQKRPVDCAALEAELEALMLAHRMTASDKDIAKWIQGELRFLFPSLPAGLATGRSRALITIALQRGADRAAPKHSPCVSRSSTTEATVSFC